MSMMSPELTRAVHDDRRTRLLAEAEARRVRRDLRAARRAEAPVRRGGGRLGMLLRRGRRHDPKVARLARSWLDLDDRTALELARVADELAVATGTTLVPGRFSYVGLDDAHRGLLVTTGTPPVTMSSSATVLVVTTIDLETVLPGLRDRAVVRPEPDPDPPLQVGRRDHVVRRRAAPTRAPELEGARVVGSARG